MRMQIKPQVIDVIEDDGMYYEPSTGTYYNKDDLEPISEIKGLDEVAEKYALDVKAKPFENLVKEAFKHGAIWRDSQIPKLPSNLDEAAVQFAQRGYSPFDDPYEASKVFENDVNCFKVGAEWMAMQGYTTEGIAHPDDCEVWVNFTSTDIKDGDEVIIQIRKK